MLIRPLAYTKQEPGIVAVPAKRRLLHSLPQALHRWYDWHVSWLQAPGTAWRFAGHAENGQASVTDPAMRGAARLRHASGVPADFRA